MIDANLVAYLQTVPGLSAVSSRYYPNIVPITAAFPAAAYERVNSDTDPTYDGPPVLRGDRFNVVFVASSSAQARELANAAHGALQGHRGAFGGATVDGVIVSDLSDSRDAESEKYLSEITFTIWHREA